MICLITGRSVEYAITLWAEVYEKYLTKLDSLEVEVMHLVTGATSGSNIAKHEDEEGMLHLPSLGARSGPKKVVIQVGQMVTSLISIHVR